MKTIAKIFGAFTAFVLLAFSFALISVYLADKNPINANTQTTEQIPLDATKIFNLVNAERVKAGLKPLIRDPRLDETAQARADDMVARNYFSHYDPVTGEDLAKILNRYYPSPCSKVSENISKVDEVGEKNTDAVKGWMNSKPHHDAILLPEYTHTGVAVRGNVSVQHFCIAK